MKKLFEKDQVMFAVMWIVIYVVGTSLAENLSEMAGMEKSVTAVFHLALSAVLFTWVKKNKLFGYFGLCRPEASARQFLYYIPLAVLVSCNLWFGVKMNLAAADIVCCIVSMICVGFLEELIMRGFLFKAMAQSNVKSAIIVSSVTFGIGHIVNLFNGSGAELLSNICQVCYAIGFGFLFVTIFYRGKTLIPCIAAHSTINVLSIFGNSDAMTNTELIIVSLILIVISAAYTLVLVRTIPVSSGEE